MSSWSQSADVAVVNNREAFRKVRRKLTDHKGNVAWIEVNKVPLRDQAGKIVGILSTAENITRELDLEKQLLQSQKMEAIGTLAGGIAHDFNNILTSIINSTELAIGDVAPGIPDRQRPGDGFSRRPVAAVGWSSRSSPSASPPRKASDRPT